MDDYKYKMVRLMHLYLSGVITDGQMQELQAWLDAAPEHKALFDGISAREVFSSKYKAYEKIDRQAALEHFENRAGIKTWGTRVWLKYAALLVLPLGVALYLFLNQHTGQPVAPVVAGIFPGEARATLFLADGQPVMLKKDSTQDIIVGQGVNVKSSHHGIVYRQVVAEVNVTQYNTLTTPRGGEFDITLSDGSVVHLNSATRLKYPVAFDAEKREVYLSGEAYFEVSKDANRPFHVITDGMRIQVYGTSFNVNTHDEKRIQTVLVDGNVGITVDGSNREYLMKPAQLAEYNRDHSSVEVKDVDVEPYVAWKDGYFVFEDESLEEIMNTLSLWYDVDLFYVNPQLKGLHFTGHMKRYDQIDSILRAIGSAVGVTFTVKGRSIWISK